MPSCMGIHACEQAIVGVSFGDHMTFRDFLCGQMQRVKMCEYLNTDIYVVFGVLQGGVLSQFYSKSVSIVFNNWLTCLCLQNVVSISIHIHQVS